MSRTTNGDSRFTGINGAKAMKAAAVTFADHMSHADASLAWAVREGFIAAADRQTVARITATVIRGYGDAAKIAAALDTAKE